MSEKLTTYGLESERGDEWLKTVLKSKPAANYYIELAGFKRGGTESLGGISKEQHAKNFIRAYYPWIWSTWSDWLELILWAWCNYEEVGATGCMASGKSYGFSLMVWLEWMCAPLQSAAVLSSTTKPALKARLWHHVKKFRGALYHNGNQFCHPCHIIDSQTLIQAQKGDDMHSMTAVAVEGGKLEDALGNVQGRHPDRMIIFADEGEQVPDALFSARLNLRGGTSFYRFATAANAVNPSSSYGQFIEPKAGWASARDTDQYWDTKTGVCLHMDGLECANVKAGKVVVPGLIKIEDVNAVRAAKGEDSLEWWAYVRGFPPMSGVRNTVLTWAAILSNKATAPAIWQGVTITIGSLDAAFTSGGDKCMLRFARVGLRDDGKNTLCLEPPIQIKLVASTEISEDYQIAERIKEECNARGVLPQHFAMDSTACTSLASMIEQRWKPGIKRVNFGSSPTDRKMPGETKTAKDRCKNRVGELWFAFAALVRSGQVRGLDPDAAQEFCTRQYRLEGEKYVLEKKSEMKERTGGKSPDSSDAGSLLGDVFRDISGIEGTEAVVASSDAWKKAEKKFTLRPSYA